MTSDALFQLAARLSAYALHHCAIEPEFAVALERELLKHAHAVAALETRPFIATAREPAP